MISHKNNSKKIFPFLSFFLSSSFSFSFLLVVLSTHYILSFLSILSFYFSSFKIRSSRACLILSIQGLWIMYLKKNRPTPRSSLSFTRRSSAIEICMYLLCMYMYVCTRDVSYCISNVCIRYNTIPASVIINFLERRGHGYNRIMYLASHSDWLFGAYTR